MQEEKVKVSFERMVEVLTSTMYGGGYQCDGNTVTLIGDELTSFQEVVTTKGVKSPENKEGAIAWLLAAPEGQVVVHKVSFDETHFTDYRKVGSDWYRVYQD